VSLDSEQREMERLRSGNLLRGLPSKPLAEEIVEPLLTLPGMRIERIVSTGQATPEGQWYDQETDEWVLLVRGAARLRLEGEAEDRALGPGDFLLLPAHCRHRVDWTDPNEVTVWLAIHFEGSAAQR
jgi:cupin 2 domain-containing protein